MSNRMVSSLSSSSSSSSSPFSFAIILFLFSSSVSSSSSSSSSSSTLFFFLFVANIHPFIPYFNSRVGGQHNASWMQRKNCGGSEKATSVASISLPVSADSKDQIAQSGLSEGDDTAYNHYAKSNYLLLRNIIALYHHRTV